MRLTHTACLAIALTLGCVIPGDTIRYSEMAPRLEYQGFSFDRPPNEHWFIPRAQQTHSSVGLSRELEPPSEVHTFYARVTLHELEREPTSQEDFAALARAKTRGRDVSYEVTEVSAKQELVTKQGQWCVRFEYLDAVRGAPVAPNETLTMRTAGFRCRHPAFPPKGALDFFCSERSLAPQPDPELWKECEAFLAGVRIDVAPGEPAK